MTEHLLTLASGTKLAPNHEIFSRHSSGQIDRRLGFVADIVPALSIYVERVVERRDDAAIIGAMRGMLDDNRLLDLKLSYQSILESFQTYAEHGQEHTAVRTQHLCTEAAPAFKDSFEKALEAIKPHEYEFSEAPQVRGGLSPLITAADAYVVVLSIGFHTQTVLTPNTAHLDGVIKSHIEQAIRSLETRLQNVLIPNWSLSRSAMAALLLRGDEEGFERYYPHCTGYEGVGGIVRLAAKANELKSDTWDGYKSAQNYRYVHMLYVADVLLEVIARFKSLLDIRLSYKLGSEPLADPIAITARHAQDGAAITVQKMEE